MMSRNKLSLLVLVMIFAIAVAPVLQAQEATEGVVTIAEGETIQIGFSASLSGDVIPEAGIDMQNAVQLAVNQYNEAGGLEGFQVELLVEDDQCAPDQATAIANLFSTEPRLVAVVGHMCSGATIAASEIYEEARIPMMSPSATAGAVTDRGLTVVNRTAFSDAAQGIVDARFIFETLGVTQIAVLHDNSDYGKGLAEGVAAAFEELGGELVAETQAINPEDQDFRAVLTPLADAEPELIFFGGYGNEAALLVTQMQEVGLEDTYFFAGDGVKVESFLELAGENAEEVYVSFGAPGEFDEEAAAEFDAMYEEAYGVAPDDLGPFHAQAYDAVNAILMAVESVAEVADGSLTIDREALIEAVRATADYQGLSGAINCNENGDCGAGLIQVFVVEDGEFVEEEVPAEFQIGGEAE